MIDIQRFINEYSYSISYAKDNNSDTWYRDRKREKEMRMENANKLADKKDKGISLSSIQLPSL